MIKEIILALIGAYFLGAIPFGFIIAGIWQIDIRQKGSGNTGATNVFRIMGPMAGSTVFLLDLFKGTAAIYIMRQLTLDPLLIISAGFVAVLGHSFSVFLGLKGGRGAATGLGVLLGIAPQIFALTIILAAAVLYLTRYVSVMSMTTTVFVAYTLFIQGAPLPYIIVSALITLLIIVRHIPNIKRLASGQEPKIGEKHV